MVVAEDPIHVPYSVHKQEQPKPRLAYDEFQRLLKIVRTKRLEVSETQLMDAVYTGKRLFYSEESWEDCGPVE